MCYGCWEENGSPKIINHKVIEAAALIPDINHYGPLHIVIDDWNLEDSHIIWCRDEWDQPKSEDELKMCAMFLDMTEDERCAAMALADGFWEITPPTTSPTAGAPSKPLGEA